MLGAQENDFMLNFTSRPKNITECKAVCDAGGLNSADRQRCYNRCVEQFTTAKPQQDAGALLEGSANVLNSVSGLWATYLMGKNGGQTMGTTSMDFGTPLPEDQTENRPKTGLWIVGGLAVVAVGTILYLTLKKD